MTVLVITRSTCDQAKRLQIMHVAILIARPSIQVSAPIRTIATVYQTPIQRLWPSLVVPEINSLLVRPVCLLLTIHRRPWRHLRRRVPTATRTRRTNRPRLPPPYRRELRQHPRSPRLALVADDAGHVSRRRLRQRVGLHVRLRKDAVSPPRVGSVPAPVLRVRDFVRQARQQCCHRKPKTLNFWMRYLVRTHS
jgi:hypothetical protein